MWRFAKGTTTIGRETEKRRVYKHGAGASVSATGSIPWLCLGGHGEKSPGKAELAGNFAGVQLGIGKNSRSELR